jgi:hypothetical protein
MKTISQEALMLRMLLRGSADGLIEEQEAHGQQALAASSELPKPTPEVQGVLERMGVEFGDPSDDLFVCAKLPEGWEVQPTDHPMWSDLVNEKGAGVASIFYKAAFYDRSARMSLTPRASVRADYGAKTLQVVVEGDICHQEPWDGESYDRLDALEDELRKQMPEDRWFDDLGAVRAWAAAL